jgi:hypothetical protein
MIAYLRKTAKSGFGRPLQTTAEHRNCNSQDLFRVGRTKERPSDPAGGARGLWAHIRQAAQVVKALPG